MRDRPSLLCRIVIALCLFGSPTAKEAWACTPTFLDLGPDSILDDSARMAVSAALIGCAEELEGLAEEERGIARDLVSETLTRAGLAISDSSPAERGEFLAALSRRLGRAVAADVFFFGATRLEPAETVTLSTSRSNSGWMLVFHLAEPNAVREILYRYDDQEDFTSTGCSPSVDPHSGELAPLTWTVIPDEWITPGEHRVAVKLVRFDRRTLGPVTLTFDVEEEILANAKHTLAMSRNGWISYTERDNATYLMFTHLLSYKDALREIRYSIDDCSLSERFEFDPWHDLTRRPRITEDKSYLGLPKSTRSACVQLVFRDGTESEIREIRRRTDPRTGPAEVSSHG